MILEKNFSVRLPVDLHLQLQEVSRQQDRAASYLIRRALQQYLEKVVSQKPPEAA